MSRQKTTVDEVTYAWGVRYTSKFGEHVQQCNDEASARRKAKGHRGAVTTATPVRAVRGPWEVAPDVDA